MEICSYQQIKPRYVRHFKENPQLSQSTQLWDCNFFPSLNRGQTYLTLPLILQYFLGKGDHRLGEITFFSSV